MFISTRYYLIRSLYEQKVKVYRRYSDHWQENLFEGGVLFPMGGAAIAGEHTAHRV
jgi:Uma2 family endonuclease